MAERRDTMKPVSTLPIKDMSTHVDAKYYEYADPTYDYDHIGQFPIPGAVGMERFLPLLPIERIEVEVPGRVGDTPLQQAKTLGQAVGLNKLWIKHEETNPTGCFKDRESA